VLFAICLRARGRGRSDEGFAELEGGARDCLYSMQAFPICYSHEIHCVPKCTTAYQKLVAVAVLMLGGLVDKPNARAFKSD
jgi:hypothetical protein